MQVASKFGPVGISLAAISKESSLASRHEVDSSAAFHDTAPICIARGLYCQFFSLDSQDRATDDSVVAGSVFDTVVECLSVGNKICVEHNIVNVIIGIVMMNA